MIEVCLGVLAFVAVLWVGVFADGPEWYPHYPAAKREER